MICLRSRRIHSFWEQHPVRDRYKQEVFDAFFQESLRHKAH
jgi:hypothetical protein